MMMMTKINFSTLNLQIRAEEKTTNKRKNKICQKVI